MKAVSSQFLALFGGKKSKRFLSLFFVLFTFFLSFSSFAQDPQTNSITSDNNPTPIQRFIENLKNYKASQVYKNGPENKTIKPTAPELFENSVEYIIRGGMRGYVKSPGGSGKTGAYSHIIQGGIQGTDLKAIVVTPYKNLVKKKKNEIAELTNIDPANIGVYYSKEKDLTKQVTVITPNSFKKLVEQGIIKTQDYPIIMLDEVDNDWITAIGKKVIDNLPKSIVIGWTATAGDENQKEVSQILPDEIFRMTIREAIQERGLLKNLNVVVYTFDLVDISEADQGGKEYNQETLGKKQMEHEEVSRIGFDAIKLFTDDFKKPFIVNCTNIKLAKKIAEDWTKWGAPVEAVYSDDEDRENVLDRFESTETTGISNVRVMSRGYHNSKLGVVINFDPTLSYKKAEQRNRGSSFDKDNPDVENVMIEMVYANSKRDSNGDPIQILYSKVANGNPIYRKGVPVELTETTKKVLKDKMEKSIQEAIKFFGKPISVKALSSAEEVLALTNKISQKRSIFSASQTVEEIKKFNDAVKSGKLEKLIGSDNFKKLTQEILREERSLGNKNSTISNPMYLITGDNSYFRTRSIVGVEGKIWMSLSDLVISPQFAILGPSHGRRWQKISGVEFRIDKEVQYYINRYNRELDGGRLEQFLGTQNYAALKEKNFHELRIENANNYVKIFIYYGKSHGWFELSEINLHINGNFWNQFEKPAAISQITPETHPLLFPKSMVDFDLVDRVTEVFPVVIPEDQSKEYVVIFVDGVKQKVSLSLLTTRIVHSDLGTRATNALQANKIYYVGELILMTKEELMSLRNFGNKTMKEIEYFLKSQDLSLGSKINEETKQIFIDHDLKVYDENVFTDKNEQGGKKVRVSVNGQDTEVYLSDLVKRIEDTDIRVRAFRGVRAVGLKFLFELAIESDESLLRMKARNFGLKSIAEIRQVLKMHGLDFNTTFDDETIKTIYEYAKVNDIQYILEKIENGSLKSRITNVQKMSFDDTLSKIRNWNDFIMVDQMEILLLPSQMDKVYRNKEKYFIFDYKHLEAAYKLFGKEAGWMSPQEFINSKGFKKLGEDGSEPWDKILTKEHHDYLGKLDEKPTKPTKPIRVYEKEEIENFTRKGDWAHLLEILPNSKLSISVVKPIIRILTEELGTNSTLDRSVEITLLKTLYALEFVDDKLIYTSLVDLRNSPYLNTILTGEPPRLGKIINEFSMDLANGLGIESLLYNEYFRLSSTENTNTLIKLIESERISQPTADKIIFAVANKRETKIEDELKKHLSPTVTTEQVLAWKYAEGSEWQQAEKYLPSKPSIRNLWQTERTIVNSKIANGIAIAAYKAKKADVLKLMEKQPGFSAADQLMDIAYENKDVEGIKHFAQLPSATTEKVIQIRDRFPKSGKTYETLLQISLNSLFEDKKATPGKTGKDYRKRNGWGGENDDLFSFMHPEDGPTNSYERDQRGLAGEGPMRPGQFGSGFGRGNEAMAAGGSGRSVPDRSYAQKAGDAIERYDSKAFIDAWRAAADDEKNNPNLEYKDVGLWDFVANQYARLISKNKYVTADAFYSDSNSTTHDFSDWVGDYFLSDEFPTVEFTAIETIIKTMLPKKLADRVLVGDLLVANPTYIFLESINAGDLEITKFMSKWMDETIINVAFAKSIKNKKHKIAEFLLSEYEISNKAFEVGKRLFNKVWSKDNSIDAKATRDILAKRIIVTESDRGYAAEIEKYFPELSAPSDQNTNANLTAADLVKNIRNGDDFKNFVEQHNYEQRRRLTKQIHTYTDYLRLQEEFQYPVFLTDGLEGEELVKLKAFLVLYDDKSKVIPEVPIVNRVNHPPKLGTNEYSKLAFEAIHEADSEKFISAWKLTNEAKHNPFLQYEAESLWKLLQKEYFESLFVTVRDPRDPESVTLKYAKFREKIGAIKRTDPVSVAQIRILRKWILDGNVKDKAQLKKIKNLEDIIETIISNEGAYKFFDAAVYLEPISFFKQAAGYDHLEDVKAMAPWMSEKSIHDALLFAAILKAPSVLEYLLQDKRVTDAMLKEAVTAANQDASDVSAKALKCREILKHPRDIKIVKNGLFSSESLEKLPVVGPIMKVINDLGFKASTKVNGLFFGKDSRPAIDQIEESIRNTDATKFEKLWKEIKTNQNSTWFNENQKKLQMIAVNQYIEEIANVVDDSFKSYMDRKNIPSGVLLSPMQFKKWLSDRKGQLPEEKNKNRIDAISKILQSLLSTDVLQAFYNGQLNSNLEMVNVTVEIGKSVANKNPPSEKSNGKDQMQAMGITFDWINETFTIENAQRVANNWRKGIVAGINHLIGNEESEKTNLAGVKIEDEKNDQKSKSSSNATILSIATGKKIVITATEAMVELRGMIGEMNHLGTVEAKEAQFEKNKTRFLALQDVLVKSRDHRVEVVRLLGSVSVVDRGLEHAKAGATTEFPKFFMASMLAQAVSHIGEDETTPERSVDFTDQVMEMFKHNGMFALNASFAGVAFDTFVPLLSTKFESAYRAKVMKQMLTGAKTKSMQDVLQRETSLMDGFARNQFTMFAATYLNLCIFGEKGMTWEEKLLQAGTSQVTFLAAQIVVRGGMLGALRASKVLEGMRVVAPADWVITTVVFSLDLIFQNWINRALGLEEQNMKLQDQVMRGYAAFHKGHKAQDFNYLVQSLSMYWDQVVMRGVQNVTYNYQKKQNEADDELSFIRQVEDGALDSYPIVGKEGATQEKRNELWRNYYIEAGEVQRKVKETLDPQLRSLIGEITNQQNNLSKTQQACKTMNKDIVQMCGMALINLPIAIEGVTRELLAKGFTTRSYQSPMEALQSITLIPDKYTTNDWVRLMVTIAKEGNREQRLQMITLLQELLTRDLRVKPENFQVQEMEVIAGYNPDLIKKYGNLDTKKHTVTLLIPQGQDTKAKTLEAFLEMAYLKKCKLKNQVNPQERFAKQYPKQRRELTQDKNYQVQKAKFIQQIQQAWFKDSLKLPDDRDWTQTRTKLKNQPEPPVIHVLQTLHGDRLGTPYTQHILTTPIFDVDLQKYENILTCETLKSPSTSPSRASFFH